MLELAGQGSRVLHLRSVEFASKYNVPLRVASSFAPGPGTLICREEPRVEAPVVSGIAFNRDEAEITVAGVPDTPGTAHRLLRPVSDANIEVDMIVLNAPRDGKVDLTFTVHRDDYAAALELVTAASATFSAAKVSGDNGVAKLSVVGRRHAFARRCCDAPVRNTRTRARSTCASFPRRKSRYQCWSMSPRWNAACEASTPHSDSTNKNQRNCLIPIFCVGDPKHRRTSDWIATLSEIECPAKRC